MSTNTISPKPSTSRPPTIDLIGDVIKPVGTVIGGTLLGITMLTSSVVAGGLVGLAISFRNLPDVRQLRNYVPTETSYIYDIKGRLLTRIHGEANREVVTLNQISPHLKRAVLAIEDSRFYQHPGINPQSVARAFLANLEEGEVVEGSSTITMQLVKNLFLSPERSYSRKMAEAILAMRLEHILTKDQIFELYLNQVYWGHNTYGVETAAQSYFAKSASELTLAEGAMMAGLIQAPEEYSPFINYKLTKQRQAIVLRRMRELGWITVEQEQQANDEKLLVGKPTSFRESQIPYLTEAVVQELSQKFGGKDTITKGGLRVQTTLDLNFQRMAEQVVSKWHDRLYYQGLFYNYKQGQIALVAVDPRTHFVKAMVGGVDYKVSQYNRAIMARRQPGSAFKPFVYYTAFASGKYGPNSTVQDTPARYWDGNEYYRPQNYGGGFSGPVTIRKALETSLNIPAVRIGQAVGINKVIEVVRALGIKSPIEPVISLPLGSVDLTPLEMASAFATFANNGWHSDTTFIVRVTDTKGNILLDNTPKPKRVLDPWAVASLNDVLRGVITRGTATSANIGRPAAGKTGTTSSERDIWFVGYVPQLAVAVWVGNDDYRPLGYGATGGGFVAPIWRDFMHRALVNEPVVDFRKSWEFHPPR